MSGISVSAAGSGPVWVRPSSAIGAHASVGVNVEPAWIETARVTKRTELEA
jgi:hypothetical protein